MFGVMHLISVISGNYKYKIETMTEASLFVIIFCIVYLFTRVLLAQNNRYDTNYSMSYEVLCEDLTENESRITFFTIILIILTVLNFRHMSSISGGLLNSSWTSWREYTTTRDYVSIDTLETIMFNVLGGLACYCMLSKKWVKMTVCILCIFASVLVTRNRVLVIPAFVSVITYIITKIKRIRIKTIFLGIFAGILVIYIVYGIRIFRHYGSIQQFVNNFTFSDFIGRINNYLLTDNGELGLREYFYYFIDRNNNFEGFGYGAGYLRMLLVYIPTRFSLGLKPDDFAQTMGAAVGKAAGGSMHPTLFGDCFANLGWFGVLLGIFWAVYAFCQDSIITRFKKPFYRVLAFCLISSMFVIIGRGAVYNAFFNVAWGIPLIALMSYLESHRKNVRIVFGKK